MMIQLLMVQHKTVRTRVIEFMQAPYGGRWLSGGWMTVADIADGVDAPVSSVRRVLGKLGAEKRRAGRVYVYKLSAETEQINGC